MYSETNWDYISLSDPVAVKALLMFRAELDPTYGAEYRSLLESGTDLSNVSENIHLTYIELQEVMDKTKFTQRQKQYIELLNLGMSSEDIAQELNIKDISTVDAVIENICEAISRTNKEKWRSWIKWDYKRVNTSYKQCGKCKKFKPMVYEYFRRDSRNKDGFQGRCRTCE